MMKQSMDGGKLKGIILQYAEERYRAVVSGGGTNDNSPVEHSTSGSDMLCRQ